MFGRLGLGAGLEPLAWTDQGASERTPVLLSRMKPGLRSLGLRSRLTSVSLAEGEEASSGVALSERLSCSAGGVASLLGGGLLDLVFRSETKNSNLFTTVKRRNKS